MKHRYYTKEDYPNVVEWWSQWGWPALPEMILPKTGIVVSNGDVDLCVAWLYRTDSCVCWVENFISNKEAPRELRKGSIEYLIEKITDEARNQGFILMMSSIQHEGLIKKLLASGYDKEIETGMTNLTRVL